MRSPWFTNEYRPHPEVEHFTLPVDGEHFHILINPPLGSWAAMTAEEYSRYNSQDLTPLEWEHLYLRGLAIDREDKRAHIMASTPAEYPSVVVINTTLRCNLMCKYCFANACPDNGGDMSEEVVRALVEQMMTMPNTELVTFEFQGGEPLLNLQAIKSCVLYAKQLAPYSSKLLKFRVESNGTLIDNQMCDFFREHDIAVGISLDGPKEINDRARVFPDGTGAFSAIWRGVETLRQNGLDVDGGVCTVGKHNVNCGREVASFFAENHYEFKPRPMNLLGRAQSCNLVASDDEWTRCFIEMYHASQELHIMNFSVPIHEENVYTPIRDYICLRSPCGAGRELISINPNGDIFPCDGFKAYQGFSIGNVLHENIVDMLQKPVAQQLRSRTWRDIPKCGRCLFRGMCGSCAYSCYGAFDDLYREDPQCKSRQKIFVFLMQQWIRRHLLHQQ